MFLEFHDLIRFSFYHCRKPFPAFSLTIVSLTNGTTRVHASGGKVMPCKCEASGWRRHGNPLLPLFSRCRDTIQTDRRLRFRSRYISGSDRAASSAIGYYPYLSFPSQCDAGVHNIPGRSYPAVPIAIGFKTCHGSIRPGKPVTPSNPTAKIHLCRSLKKPKACFTPSKPAALFQSLLYHTIRMQTNLCIYAYVHRCCGKPFSHLHTSTFAHFLRLRSTAASQTDPEAAELNLPILKSSNKPMPFIFLFNPEVRPLIQSVVNRQRKIRQSSNSPIRQSSSSFHIYTF